MTLEAKREKRMKKKKTTAQILQTKTKRMSEQKNGQAKESKKNTTNANGKIDKPCEGTTKTKRKSVLLYKRRLIIITFTKSTYRERMLERKCEKLYFYFFDNFFFRHIISKICIFQQCSAAPRAMESKNSVLLYKWRLIRNVQFLELPPPTNNSSLV